MTCAPGPGGGGIVLLQDLFAGVDAEVPAGAAGVDVRALTVDSRRGGAGGPFPAPAGGDAPGAGLAGPARGDGPAAGVRGPPPPAAGPARGPPRPPRRRPL